MIYNAQCGDIFLSNSNKTGAKIVKFLQQAPTIWQWLWRKIRGTQEIVRYYHAGMVLSDTQIIEQQWRVEYNQTSKILDRDIIIYRYKYINSEYLGACFVSNQVIVRDNAIKDIGKTYDIPQLIGKTLTWLTGIKLFVRILGGWSKEEEICVTRVAEWYDGICDFGVPTNSEITTKIIDEFCQSHPEEWEIVYYNKGI